MTYRWIADVLKMWHSSDVWERCRWVNNIKMDLGGIEWDGMNLINLAQDRDQWRVLVNTVMNLRVP
jgi:hypothetical protein